MVTHTLPDIIKMIYNSSSHTYQITNPPATLCTFESTCYRLWSYSSTCFKSLPFNPNSVALSSYSVVTTDYQLIICTGSNTSDQTLPFLASVEFWFCVLCCQLFISTFKFWYLFRPSFHCHRSLFLEILLFDNV